MEEPWRLPGLFLRDAVTLLSVAKPTTLVVTGGSEAHG